jgi:hypothetical protein
LSIRSIGALLVTVLMIARIYGEQFGAPPMPLNLS